MEATPIQAGGGAQQEDHAQWIAHLDGAVTEVVETMLRQRCTAVDGPPAARTTISAKIVFSGALEGHCIVHVSTAAAGRLTDALLGAEGDWDDQMIDDAVGELCNMIAGGWKSRLGPPASVCHLSVPAVSRTSTREKSQKSPATTRRFYAFDGAILEVALTLS